MQLSIIRPPKFRPNINLTNERILFIADEYDGILQDHVVVTGSDIFHDTQLVPWVITEHKGEDIYFHHFVQDTRGSKSFPDLLPVSVTHYSINKGVGVLRYSNNQLYLPTIINYRDTYTLEHANLAVICKLEELIAETERIMYNRQRSEISDYVSFQKFIDKLEAIKILFEDNIMVNPFLRNGLYIGSAIFPLIESTTSCLNTYQVYGSYKVYGLDKEEDTHNESILKYQIGMLCSLLESNSAKLIKNLKELNESSVIKLLKRNNKFKLTDKNLDTLMKVSSGSTIYKYPEEPNPEDNNITEKDIDTEGIAVSDLHQLLIGLELSDIKITIVRGEDGRYQIEHTSKELPEASEVNEQLTVHRSGIYSDILEFITKFAKLFKFEEKINRIYITSSPYHIKVSFDLKSEARKSITYSSVMSSLASPALLEI